jgi:threonine/homoserine/homoserine lactone efflux protein
VLSVDRLLAYALASFILIVIPGPSVLFAVGRALAHGRRTALVSVVGNTIGLFTIAVCVSLGIGTVVERSIVAFTVVKLVGAGYLIWLGARAFRRRASLSFALAGPAASRGDLRTVREGFVVGVANPKAMILLTAVLPQFVDRSAGHVPFQMLVMGAMSTLIGLLSDSAWAVAASGARDWFIRSPRRLGLVGGAGGLMMIGVGVAVAATGRKD